MAQDFLYLQSCCQLGLQVASAMSGDRSRSPSRLLQQDGIIVELSEVPYLLAQGSGACSKIIRSARASWSQGHHFWICARESADSFKVFAEAKFLDCRRHPDPEKKVKHAWLYDLLHVLPESLTFACKKNGSKTVKFNFTDAETGMTKLRFSPATRVPEVASSSTASSSVDGYGVVIGGAITGDAAPTVQVEAAQPDPVVAGQTEVPGPKARDRRTVTTIREGIHFEGFYLDTLESIVGPQACRY